MAEKKNRAIHVFTHIKSTYLDGLVCSNTSTEISILRPIFSTCKIDLSIEVECSRVQVQNILRHDGITWTNHQYKLTCIWRDIWTYFPVGSRWRFNVGSKPEVAYSCAKHLSKFSVFFFYVKQALECAHTHARRVLITVCTCTTRGNSQNAIPHTLFDFLYIIRHERYSNKKNMFPFGTNYLIILPN